MLIYPREPLGEQAHEAVTNGDAVNSAEVGGYGRSASARRSRVRGQDLLAKYFSGEG